MVNEGMEYSNRVNTPKMTYNREISKYTDDRNYSNESCRTVIVLPIQDTLIDERKRSSRSSDYSEDELRIMKIILSTDEWLVRILIRTTR